MPPLLITIPTTDAAFRHFVERTIATTRHESASEFESRLRRTYARAAVRERGLTGESRSWYVYRDGAWRHPDGDRWWDDPGVPRIAVSADGWIEDINATARGVLGIDSGEPRHFTDFVVAGGLEDAMTLFEIVRDTGMLEATVVVQPTTGDALPVDIRVSADGDRVVGVFRLAGDIDARPSTAALVNRPERLEFFPTTDVAFRSYAQRALARMPEPTPDGLALRLRRLYPHAQVQERGEAWIAHRDHALEDTPRDAWWTAEGLPSVRYDSMALILEANDSAGAFFGRSMVGHHWQEFVTAGSTDEVAAMLEILSEAGAAESRFRMPRGDGSLLEFDSYTVARDGEFTTVFRPVPGAG